MREYVPPMAASTGNATIVKTLLNAGADPAVRDMRGMTALVLAVTAESQNAEVVRLLLKKKADVNAADQDGRSALDWAKLWGETPIVNCCKSPAQKQMPGKRLPPPCHNRASAAKT